MKLIFRLLVLCNAFVLFNYAETLVDDDIRVLVIGNVKDQDNNPIEAAHIEIVTDADGPGALSIILSEGFSNDLGDFNITSLFGSNTLFYIEVSFNNNYSTYTYRTNTQEFRPDDLVFNLGDITLNQLSRLNYSIVRESGLGNTLDFTFSYNNPFCTQIFDENILNIEESFCFDNRFISRNLNDNFLEIENRSFVTALNQTVIFRYSINGEAEEEEIFIVNSEDYEFEFTY